MKVKVLELKLHDTGRIRVACLLCLGGKMDGGVRSIGNGQGKTKHATNETETVKTEVTR